MRNRHTPSSNTKALTYLTYLFDYVNNDADADDDELLTTGAVLNLVLDACGSQRLALVTV